MMIAEIKAFGRTTEKGNDSRRNMTVPSGPRATIKKARICGIVTMLAAGAGLLKPTRLPSLLIKKLGNSCPSSAND